MLNDQSAKYDSNLIDTLQNHLFEFKDAQGKLQAFDLLAMNINRGRDHGIPPYNAIRGACGYPRVTSFDQLADVMSLDSINMLKSAYAYKFFKKKLEIIKK